MPADRPIIVVGCPRSGTTMLQLMLHAHPRIAIPPETRFVLHAFEARLDGLPEDGAHRAEAEDGHDVLFRRAFDAARRVTFEMRDRDEIGDDAFHRLEEDLDWLEMSAGGTGK